mgnify:CR=1 FL=1
MYKISTALLCMPLLFATLFVAGARARHLALILFLGASAIVPLYHQLEPYQRRRVDGFLAQLPLVKREPKTEEEQLEAAQLQREINYQVENSKMAVGSGGVIGVGLGHGEDEALYWVPERHTDFIFTTLSEEFGFVGSISLLGLYVLVTVFCFVSMARKLAESFRGPVILLTDANLATGVQPIARPDVREEWFAPPVDQSIPSFFISPAILDSSPFCTSCRNPAPSSSMAEPRAVRTCLR